MSMARNSKSIDPAAPKKDLLVVLLEGIHASAVVALRHAGYSRIVSHVKSLAGSELRAALAELVLAEIIMLMRGIPEKNAILHRGRWVQSAAHSFEVRGRAPK